MKGDFPPKSLEATLLSESRFKKLEKVICKTIHCPFETAALIVCRYEEIYLQMGLGSMDLRAIVCNGHSTESLTLEKVRGTPRPTCRPLSFLPYPWCRSTHILQFQK